MDFKERTLKAMELLKKQPPVTYDIAKEQVLRRQGRSKNNNNKKRNR